MEVICLSAAAVWSDHSSCSICLVLVKVPVLETEHKGAMACTAVNISAKGVVASLALSSSSRPGTGQSSSLPAPLQL